MKNELRVMNELASGLEGFNWFESSSLWTSKKYFFTNQLKLNTIVIDTIKTLGTKTSTNNNLHTFNFISNLHNSSVNLQLNELNNKLILSSSDSTVNNLLTENLHITSGDIDLLKSFNLNVINTLTSPIIEKNTAVNNYTTVNPFFKTQVIKFKK
jgi:hypothetical protein